MAHAIRAWRDNQGAHGIIIGTVYPVGYDNVVVEIILGDPEVDRFLADCAAARQRAAGAPGPFEEKLPGPYENWPEHTT